MPGVPRVPRDGLGDYEGILGTASLRVIAAEPHDEALATIIDEVGARLVALYLGGVAPVAALHPKQVGGRWQTRRTGR